MNNIRAVAEFVTALFFIEESSSYTIKNAPQESHI